MIILVSGKKRSGKDYVASLLKRKLEKENQVYIYHFADELKVICAEMLKLTVEEIDKYKNDGNEVKVNKETFMNIINFKLNSEMKDFIYLYFLEHDVIHNVVEETDNTYLHIDVRKLLQIIGTDIIKNMLNKPNYWVDIIKEKIANQHSTSDIIIIPDWRFTNEYTELLDIGHKIITLRVYGQNQEDDNHISESELDDFKFDYGADNTFKGNLVLINQINALAEEIKELDVVPFSVEVSEDLSFVSEIVEKVLKKD